MALDALFVLRGLVMEIYMKEWSPTVRLIQADKETGFDMIMEVDYVQTMNRVLRGPSVHIYHCDVNSPGAETRQTLVWVAH